MNIGPPHSSLAIDAPRGRGYGRRRFLRYGAGRDALIVINQPGDIAQRQGADRIIEGDAAGGIAWADGGGGRAIADGVGVGGGRAVVERPMRRMRRLPVVDDAVTKAAVVADPPRRGAPMDQITIMAGGRGGRKA